MKNKIIKYIVIVILLISNVYANKLCSDLKLNKEIVFGLFNGVQTEKDDAIKALRLIQTKFLDSYVSMKNERIEYVLFYNKTEGLADFAETFDQRASEHIKILKDKYEYFWDIRQKGQNSIIKNLTNGKEMIQDEIDATKSVAISSLVSLISKVGFFDKSNTTLIMMENHREKLDCIANANKKTLLFAHSQGNLFVVEAYRHMLQLVPKKSVIVIHVAPAVPAKGLVGVHFLADKDLVINGLALIGSKPSITHIIPGILLRPVGINGKTDPLGHGLLEIYLNYHLAPSYDIYNATVEALDKLEFPKKIDNPPVDEGIDPNTFDYINECKNINFPSNVDLYDKVIRKTIDLYRHLSKEEICNYIAENLPTTDTGGSTGEGGVDKGDNSETFDYKTQCSNIDFPDPIPDELENSINEAISQVSGAIDTEVLCQTIDGLVQAYNLANGGGVSSF